MQTSLAAPMSYREMPPDRELAPFVAAHWVFRVAAGAGTIEHHIPLTGGAFLSIDPAGAAVLVGPRLTPLGSTVAGGSVYCGSMFWPGGARALFGLGTTTLREEIHPIAPLLGQGWADALSEAGRAFQRSDDAGRSTLESSLRGALATAAPIDERVLRAVLVLVRSEGRTAATEVARLVGLSPRQLRRRFRASAEMSLKEFARLRRVRASAANAVFHPESWAGIAQGAGFADQAHLAREFRELIGVSPKAFERHARRIAHELASPPESDSD